MKILTRKLDIFESNFSCQDLINGKFEPPEILAAENWKPKLNESIGDVTNITNCNKILELFEILKMSHHSEEEDFPIAFAILVYKSPDQFIQLLRMIYRPWNYYCIHIDLKSSASVSKPIDQFVKCLNKRHHNIINIKRRFTVTWGHYSVLQAQMACMSHLYRYYKSWKYFINLTGQEFPLRTNWELVRILKAYKGTNIVSGSFHFRFTWRLPQKPVSFPMRWIFGSTHIVVNRQFVSYSLNHPYAKEIYIALRNAYFPDEIFFNTLNYNPKTINIPGSHINNPDELKLDNYVRYKIWVDNKPYLCKSRKYVNLLCIFGVRDLELLVKTPHLFVNKFHSDFQPAALICMERFYLFNVMKETAFNYNEFNESFYSLENLFKMVLN